MRESLGGEALLLFRRTSQGHRIMRLQRQRKCRRFGGESTGVGREEVSETPGVCPRTFLK